MLIVVYRYTESMKMDYFEFHDARTMREFFSEEDRAERYKEVLIIETKESGTKTVFEGKMEDFIKREGE